MLHSIWWQWDFATPEMLERSSAYAPPCSLCTRVPTSVSVVRSKTSGSSHSPSSQYRQMVTTPKLGSLRSPNRSLPPHVASAGDWYPVGQGTWYRPTHCSCELKHHNGCNTSRVSQVVWTQGTFCSSERNRSHWSIPKRSRSWQFCLSCLLLPGWPCVSWAQGVFRHKQHSWIFAAISGACGAIPCQHPNCSSQLGAWQSSISWGQDLAHNKISNYLIKNHLKAQFSMWGREKVTRGDATIDNECSKIETLQNKPGCSKAVPQNRYSTSRIYINVRSSRGITLKSHRIY